MTDTPRADTPPARRREASPISTTTAIIPARSTVDSGVTSTINPNNATRLAIIRTLRRNLNADAAAKTSAVTTAQFAPDIVGLRGGGVLMRELTVREYLRVSKDDRRTGKSPDQQHNENLLASTQDGSPPHPARPYRVVDRSASRYARPTREDF